MHGDEPGTDLNTVNGEPIRQQGQQGFGDQERYKLRGVWFPLCEHPSSFSHHAPPSLRKGQASSALYNAHRTRDRGHGRHETRSARTITTPKIVARVTGTAKIQDIRCLCRIERTRITQDGIVTTGHYHISSRALTPREYARRVRSHWRIEALHHVLDVSLHEDACRICDAAGVVGFLRRLAYAVIAERRGKKTFAQYSQMMHANPTSLLNSLTSSP